MIIQNFKLFEVHGISIDVMEWTEFIYGAIIRHGIPLFMKKALKGDLEDEVEIDGKDYIVDTGQVKLSGKRFDNLIKYHISKDSELLMRNFILDLDITLMDEEIWTLDYFNAFYSDENAKMRYENLEKARIYIDIYLPNTILEVRPTIRDIDKFLNDYAIRPKIYEIVAHEVDHAFEYFQRRDKKQEIFPERLLNFLISINRKNKFAQISENWQDFLDLCYLHLSFEQNARVTQLYYGLKDTEMVDIHDFWYYIKNHNVWKDLVKLKNFDAEEFYDNFEIDADEQDLKDAFKEMHIYSDEEIENEDIKKLVLKYLIKYWNDSIDEVNDEYAKYGKAELEKLPTSALNEPMVFLKFFEKRFHKNWEKFYRKVCRLSVDLMRFSWRR